MKITAVDGAFLHSEEWRKLAPLARLDRYLRALGIPVLEKEVSVEKHVVKLQKQHGACWDQVQEIIQQRARGELSADLYAVKNASLELSLSVAALAVGVYRGLLSQVSYFSPAPNTILDIGCENGLLACYFALLYPNAKVVGMDPSERAVGCARELARLLGINSASFHVGTATNVAEIGGKDFEVVLAITVYEDAGVIPDHGAQDARVGFTSPNPIHPLAELEALRAVTAPTGFWISLERCRYPTDLAWWLDTIAASGWDIDWANSHKLDCSLHGERNELPLAMARPRNPSPVPLDRAMIQALWLSARFSRSNEQAGAEAWVFRNESARASRAVLKIEQMLRCARGESDGIWEQIEVGISGPFAFFYAEDSQGVAVLRWRVLTQLQQLLDEWECTIEQTRERHGDEAVTVEISPAPGH